MKLLAALCAVLALVLTGCAPVDELPRDQVRKLQADGGVGSGVVIRPGLVLTAGHVAGVKELRVRARGKPGTTVAARNDSVDLGLVYFPSAEAQCPCVTLADYDAQRDEPVYVIGYPRGIAQVVTEGKAQSVTNVAGAFGMFGMHVEVGQRLIVTATAAPGNSGGGVFVLREGEYQLVGVVVEIAGDLTLAMPLSKVRAFLKEHA